jgi:hypothetical protein
VSTRVAGLKGVFANAVTEQTNFNELHDWVGDSARGFGVSGISKGRPWLRTEV